MSQDTATFSIDPSPAPTELTSTVTASSNVRCGDNFYLHVNKSWLDDPANQIPGEYPRWGGFIKLHDEGLKNQISLVKELRDKKDKNEEEAKISAIWEASTRRFQSWRDGTANYDPISRELEILDAYLSPQTPVKDDHDYATRLAEYLYYTQINGIGNVFDFDKGSDLTNANNMVLDFSTTGLSLPSREYYTESNFSDKRDMYKSHLRNVAQLISSGSSVQLDEAFVENVFSFESELAKYKMKQEQGRRYDEYYTNTTLTDLHQKIETLASLAEKQENYDESERNFVLNESQRELVKVFLEKVYSLFNFRKILAENRQHSFIEKGVENPPHEEHVTAFDGDAIRRVFAMVLNKDNLLRYRSFLQYKIVRSFKEFCTKEIDDEFFDFYSRKLNGQAEQKPEDKRSIQVVNGYADEMMGKVFVAKYFPESCKKDIRESIADILSVMRESIQKNDWLTQPTKEKALVKLDKFNVKVGYPDVWKDYSLFDVKEGDSLYDISKKAKTWGLQQEFFNKLNTVLDRNDWLMSPQTVNAYFMPTQNEIVFPAAILQPPFYCKQASEIDVDLSDERAMITENESADFTHAVNLGGIGAVIAHEITHGYDDKGRKFDGDGNLNDWWTPEDAKLFTAKTDVMGEQAEQYRFIDTDDSNKEYRLNPKLTMGENLADLGGISLALQALTRRLEKSGASESTIKSHKRALFKSFANIWKQNTKKDFKINQLTTDPHSPSDFRANLVRNMDEFYEVFGVTETDAMYLPSSKRVRMW
ncbi:peptidase M13 [Yasminevirus sp. GU-2018]|uniref:Peptidase M13 n=1 Tax=Yasminevirus sp. GU-2018 TaxID=2420051 RepID=A0A5K0UA98_9VIRU|nr:peptidase M13 [Yasminevirus sp. GU-2018]